MELGNDFVSPDKRITQNDFRSDQYWSERPDESTAGDGWTWVAALLVAALFIVSGYLDQESGISHASSASGAAGTYTSSSAPQASIASASVSESDRRSDKGY